MDAGIHVDGSQTSATPSRKRNRDNETDQQRVKREKAAERQRRKRERDRHNANSITGMTPYFTTPPGAPNQRAPHQPQPPLPQPDAGPSGHQLPPQPPPPMYTGTELTPEEHTRREKVRASARERQRKHRLLVKQRKMKELGFDMGNEILPGMEEVHYRMGADGTYQQVPPHEVAQLQQQGLLPPPAENAIPAAPPVGGQTFASTLLLSFSCAPLLKQHLLRTLSMSNEELASLEPIIAEAWDRWDHQRRLHGTMGVGPPPGFLPVEQPNGNNLPFPPPPPGAEATSNEFRARFHRSLAVPAPFRTYNEAAQAAVAAAAVAAAVNSAPNSAASAPSDSAIDPHLGGTAGPSANGPSSESRSQPGATSLEPDFRQARGEAEDLAGRLDAAQ
ncbi:hypothetical protein HGRIS_012670 [Hohenbuehelia grisea]|uniref:Uncharacterized protein n=1 Tax=Hohenbuehelia grisea TaxID=104357 RepID=A0ABR3IT26_9AGAR